MRAPRFDVSPAGLRDSVPPWSTPTGGGRGLRRGSATAGFTLLEILAAISIFTLMAVFTVTSLDRSTDNALTAIRARELRFLAERKLGEIAVFEREFDDIFTDDFGDYDDAYADWEWKLDIRDVIVFGESADEDAEYLFGRPDEDDTDTTDGTQPQEQPKGETQFLRELTLTVTAPTDDGEGDSVSVVVFLPLVDHGAAAPGGPAGNGTGGNGTGGNGTGENR